MSTRHVYIDETKGRGYVLVASAHLGPEVDEVRKDLRRLVLRGQQRIHMAKERDARRKAIIDTVIAAGVSATVYDAGRRYDDDRAARVACLRAIIDDITPNQPTLLVTDQDDTLVRSDRRQLVELAHASGHRDSVRYQHQRAKSELLLTIPDAIAWCWARGGEWRQRVSPVTTVKLTPDSAKTDRSPSGTLSGSLPEAQRNRLTITINARAHRYPVDERRCCGATLPR